MVEGLAAWQTFGRPAMRFAREDVQTRNDTAVKSPERWHGVPS